MAVGNLIIHACLDTLCSAGCGDTARGVVLPLDPGFPHGWPGRGKSW
jgi:hypothetical protein